MLENLWNEYRGWAKRARGLKEQSESWERFAAVAAALAAIFGAAAGLAGAGVLGKCLAFFAAACAAITPILGKDILSVGAAGGWLKTRATAEAIKSECLRYAAKSNDYAGDDCKARLRRRCDEAASAANKIGLSPLADPATEDPRRPGEDMTLDWYVKRRLDEQLLYYAKTQQTNEKRAGRLRALSLALALAAAVLGAASATFGVAGLSAWIGVAGTLGGILLAQGLRERSQFLAANSGAMVSALGRLKAAAAEETPSLPSFVDATENLLAAEHAAWSLRMQQLDADVDTAVAADNQKIKELAESTAAKNGR